MLVLHIAVCIMCSTCITSWFVCTLPILGFIELKLETWNLRNMISDPGAIKSALCYSDTEWPNLPFWPNLHSDWVYHSSALQPQPDPQLKTENGVVDQVLRYYHIIYMFSYFAHIYNIFLSQAKQSIERTLPQLTAYIAHKTISLRYLLIQSPCIIIVIF